MRPRERPRRRPASELLRQLEVLVLNEVVEEGGAGQDQLERYCGPSACSLSRSALARAC